MPKISSRPNLPELRRAQAKELERIASQLMKMHQENSLLKDRLQEMENAADSGQGEMGRIKCAMLREHLRKSNSALLLGSRSQANELRTVLANDYEQKAKAIPG
jgi:hypothetical protein